MEWCVFLGMCLINLGTHQKVLLRLLECCFDDLNQQQTSFQMEKVSFTQFKQLVLIVLITLTSPQVSGSWWLFSGHFQKGHTFLQVGLSLSMVCNLHILPTGRSKIPERTEIQRSRGYSGEQSRQGRCLLWVFSAVQRTRSLVYLCDCVPNYTCSGGRVLGELRGGTGIQSSPGMEVARVLFENGWLSNGVRGGDAETASGRPLAQERWHIWENWTMLISVTRMQARLVRYGSQEPNQDQVRQVLWLTWTILNFISGTMVSH